MSYPVYYVPAGDVLPVFFDTFDGGTGASITMTGLAVTDIEIYKDGSTTQRASDAGFTLLDTDGIDFDSLTGIHGFSIDTGDNTDASFYTVGAWYHVIVSAITVDAQTVSFIAAAFRIMEAETTAGRPLVQTAAISAGAVSATAIATDAIDADALSADALAEINAQVLDVVNTDTFAEPTGVPPATATLVQKIGYLYNFAFRNKVEVTSSKKTFYDDGDAAEFEKDLADDGTTYSESEANAI